MPQGYICIFAKSDEPNISRIEYATDWRAKLKDINSNFYSDVYSCYAVLEVFSEDDYDILLTDIIGKINPTLRKQANKSFYNISPKDMYEALKGITKFSTRGNKPQLVDSPSVKPELKQQETKKPIDTPKANSKQTESELLEKKAIELLTKDGLKKGYKLSDELITYYRKEKNYNNYWITPRAEYFERNWSLILHDEGRKALYLFNIPAFALKPDLFEKRSGASKYYSIYIDYNDSRFTDINPQGSEFKFRKFLVAILRYNDQDMAIETQPTEATTHITKPVIEKPIKKEEPTPEPITPKPIERPRTKTEDDFKRSNVQYILVEDVDASYSVPSILTIEGINYEVDSYVDILEYIILHVLRVNPNFIDELLSPDCKTYKSQFYLTADPAILRSPHKVRRHEFYIEEEHTPNELLDYCRWLCNKTGIDTSKIYYDAYKISF